MGKHYYLKLLGVIALLIFAISCETDDDTVTSGNATSEYSIGIKSLEVKIPLFTRFEVLTSYNQVNIKLMGISDRREYTIPVTISTCYNSEFALSKATDVDNAISISSQASELENLPHQQYYLNHLVYDTDEDGEEIFTSLGATLSLEDPDDIKFLSTFNLTSECCQSDDGSVPISSYTDLNNNIFIELSEYSGENALAGVRFYQTCDINLANDAVSELGGWTAMGRKNTTLSDHYEGTAFCGEYDGQGYAIIGLNSTFHDALGFFYRLGDGANIHDLCFQAPNLSGGQYVGTLASIVDSRVDVTISNVEVSGGYVYGSDCVGGLIGKGAAQFSNCSVSAAVGCNDLVCDLAGYVGGYVGYLYVDSSDVEFELCEFTGSVEDNCEMSGGFCGRAGEVAYGNHSVFFNMCSLSGDITGHMIHGGYIGHLDGSLDVQFGSSVAVSCLSSGFYKDKKLLFNFYQKDASKYQLSVGGYIGAVESISGDDSYITFEFDSEYDYNAYCGNSLYMNYMSSASSNPSSSDKSAYIGGVIGELGSNSIISVVGVTVYAQMSKTGSADSYYSQGEDYIGAVVGSIVNGRACEFNATVACSNASSSQFMCNGLYGGYAAYSSLSGTITDSTGVLDDLPTFKEAVGNSLYITRK
ncbi:MAG: hypothetical protein R3Y39_08085 [Rikenellaceae bacterium]